MTPFKFSLLLATGILAGPACVSVAASGSTPPTYPQCQTLGLSDHACHRRMIQAGGTSGSASSSTATVTPKNFRGWSEKERWYRKYVEYCKRNHRRIQPMSSVIHHYPDFHVPIPYYLTYP